MQKSLDSLKTTCGTQPYMAPEIRHANGENAYDGTKSDLFALGQILFLTHTGTFAFEEASSKHKPFERLQKDPVKAMAKLGMSDLDADFIDLFVRMTLRDPEARCTLSEARSHPWMTKDLVATQ